MYIKKKRDTTTSLKMNSTQSNNTQKSLKKKINTQKTMLV